MFVKSRALVLHTLKYNDTSSVVLLFTEAAGSVTFLVRIPRTRRAGVKSQLFRPLTLLSVEWDHRDRTTMQHLRSAACPRPYASLPYEPLKTSIALFLSEFLYFSLREEHTGGPLFSYILSSLSWLDVAPRAYANFHLVFSLRLSRFLGFYPNTEDYHSGDLFDLVGSNFSAAAPLHPYYIGAREAAFIPLLMRMNYETMHLFSFTREQRVRLLQVINDYYRLHVPSFPVLKSIEVLREVFS